MSTDTTTSDGGWGRRPGVALEVRGYLADPYPVDVHAEVDELYDEPLFRLPEGWEDMSVEEIAAWATVEAARLGRVAGHSPVHGNNCPSDSWGEAWPLMEYAHSTFGFRKLTVLPTVEPERAPGDGWFGGARPGSPQRYRDDESAAHMVVYHEGEPVMPEEPNVEWHTYPAAWDRPVEPAPRDRSSGHRTRPTLAADRRLRAWCASVRPTRNWVGQGWWICYCADWYAGPLPPGFIDHEPSLDECHRNYCGWIA